MLNSRDIQMLLEEKEEGHPSFLEIEKYFKGLIPKDSQEYLDIEAHIKDCLECQETYNDCKELEFFNDIKQPFNSWKEVWDTVDNGLTDETRALLDGFNEFKKKAEEEVEVQILDYFVNIESHLVKEKKNLEAIIESLNKEADKEKSDINAIVEKKRAEIEELLNIKRRHFIYDLIELLDGKLIDYNKRILANLVFANIINP